MSDNKKNNLSIETIQLSDTLSQFMEKCNSNFSNLLQYGGGTEGARGDHGDQGVPTKPKVPIHIWIQKSEESVEEYHYITEDSTPNNEFEFEITSYTEDLSKPKYQEGHLIILQNAHVYSLENDGGELKPKFKLALQSYDKNSVIDGKNAYVHIAYSNTPTPTSREDFVTDQQLREENNNTEPVETYSLKRSATTYSTSTTNMDYAYMGIYSDNTEKSSVNPSKYTWVRIQGQQGIQGIQGDQGPQGIQGIRGEQGDAFTGQPFSIDLSGDMSTLSLDTNGRSLYNDGSNDCKCTLHAYYGKEKHKLSFEQDLITITPPSSDYDIIKPDMTHAEVVTKNGTKVGDIQMYVVDGNIDIIFRPDSDFDFLKKTIPFTIGVGTIVNDTNDNKKYSFIRNTIWIIKGIVSDFKLDIKPQYRIIKRLEDGNYYPKKLEVSVYKTIGGKRELFDFNDNENQSFKLLCNVDNKGWGNYPTGGVSTENTTHLEFKVVKVDKNAIEEIWDYEDVWVVADGKGTHYYHADLGNTESMMVLTTGEKEVVGTDNNENNIYCAKLRNKSGYSITFNPKFYDGTTPLTVINASVQTNIGDTDIYVNNGSFVYEDDYDKDTNKLTLTITKVPYDIDTLPLLVHINAKYDIYDEATGNVLETKPLFDTVDFNVYISTITNIYSLVPTAAAYNTSTGKTGDTIGCDVYKNNEIIPISDLNQNGLTLKYIVYSESGSEDEEIEYTEPIIYGDDSDIPEDEFIASDVAIVFILYYGDKEVVRSTVPLIKDGIDGRDGDTWQYIFCRSPYYDFAKTGISDPSEWRYDPNPDKSNAEYLGELESDYPIDENENLRWYDDHKGVDSDFRYEYQSYRKWDKYAKCWGKYGKPTLYSNYSEDGKDGSGYNVMLSNPVSVIPVGHDDWSVNENSDNQKDYTFIYLYNNTTDITSETDETGKNKVSISLPEDNKYVQNGNFTVDNNAHKVSFIPVFGEGDDRSVFDFQSNTQYKLPITVTYELGKDIDGDGIPDIFTTTVYWTLTPIKGLEDIEVFVDKRVINISESSTHNISVGYYLISNKNKQFINSEEENKNKYQIILTQDITNLSGENVDNIPSSNWSNYNFTVPSNSVNKNWYVVLVDSDGKTIIDYTNIITVKDGSDGKSAIHLELTQDYIAVPAKADGGGVHPDFGDTGDEVISSQMILYDGNVEIENKQINGKHIIEYEFKIDGETIGYGVGNPITLDVKTGKFTINDTSIIKGDTNLECIAKYGNGTFYKTVFIDLEETPYELEIDKNTLSRKVVSVDENGNITDGYIVDSSINVKVKYWKKGSWCYVTDGDGDVCVEYSKKNNGVIEEVSTSFSKPSSSPSDYTYTLTIAEDNIKNNIIDLEVKIVYKEGGNILSYENIGIINSGIDGATGAPGDTPELIETIRVGFSIEEEKNHYNPDGTINTSSNHWKASIGELGDVGIAQPIYILYEQTWKYKISQTKFVTHYITTTLSGTQGIEGKSRVLFYLGSFEKDKATLKDDVVYGHLTPERCDYYIDYNGIAWMRIGQEDKDNGGLGVAGYKNGNGDNSDVWQKSDTVGFLQSNAIHADMINAGSITVGSEIVGALFADDIMANKLKVKNANISELLTADKIDVDSLIINAANVTGTLEGNTIQSSEKINKNDPNSDAAWQINYDGSGWLANKNIEWDADGKITIQGKGTSIGQGTSIGNAWIITTEGDIKSNNDCVRFNANGSGYIGGYYEPKSKSDAKVQKGISWNEGGDVTFYDKVISKPEFINLSVGDSDGGKNSYSVNTTDKATYIFIDDDCEKTNDKIINGIDTENINTTCTCYKAYLSWFNFSNMITLENNTICNFTILNHSSKTIEFYIGTDDDEKNLRLPFKLIQDEPIPLHNYRLFNNHNVNYNDSNDTGDGSKYGIQKLFLLPGSKLDLCFENYSSNNKIVQNFYINNISDFRMCYNNDKTSGLFITSPSLMSTNYDLNNFSNYGGYSHPYTYKKSHDHLSLLRLIFANELSAPYVTGIAKIPTSYFNCGNSEIFTLIDDMYINSRSNINFNETHNNCIEILFNPSTTYGYDYVSTHGETCPDPLIYVNITNLTPDSKGLIYKTVQLLAYSPIYDTIYKSKEETIETDKDIKLSFSKKDWETLKWLGYNQQNSILDLFIYIVFKY